MAGEVQVTVVGNLAGEVDLRFTPSGAAVANFTIASTPRSFDKQAQEWKDGETLWLRCSVWRQAAENLAESALGKGTRLIVTGRLKSRSYEKDGQTRTAMELDVDEVAPSLKFATATVNKAGRSSAAASSTADDPWATPATVPAGATDSPPPF